MMDLFATIEQTPLSVWVREDLHAFFWILMAHSLGMALLVGGGLVVCLAGAGLAGGLIPMRLRGLYPAMWLGLALALLSGLLLVAGYPAKALTNPVFALKLAMFAGAGLAMWRIGRWSDGEANARAMRPVAIAGLVLWAGGVAAGKLLLYTHTHLMAS